MDPAYHRYLNEINESKNKHDDFADAVSIDAIKMMNAALKPNSIQIRLNAAIKDVRNKQKEFYASKKDTWGRRDQELKKRCIAAEKLVDELILKLESGQESLL